MVNKALFVNKNIKTSAKAILIKIVNIKKPNPFAFNNAMQCGLNKIILVICFNLIQYLAFKTILLV